MNCHGATAHTTAAPPTHSTHRRTEALREGEHTFVPDCLRLRGPTQRNLDEAVDAGLVEVLTLVLLHHTRLHHVERVAHACRHEAAVDGRARAVDEAPRRRVVRRVEVAADPLLAAVVTGNSTHRQQPRPDKRRGNTREEGLKALLPNDGEEGVRGDGVARFLPH